MAAQSYCVKCQKRVNIRNSSQITMKNGRPAIHGTCPVCDTKVFCIGKG